MLTAAGRHKIGTPNGALARSHHGRPSCERRSPGKSIARSCCWRALHMSCVARRHVASELCRRAALSCSDGEPDWRRGARAFWRSLLVHREWVPQQQYGRDAAGARHRRAWLALPCLQAQSRLRAGWQRPDSEASNGRRPPREATAQPRASLATHAADTLSLLARGLVIAFWCALLTALWFALARRPPTRSWWLALLRQSLAFCGPAYIKCAQVACPPPGPPFLSLFCPRLHARRHR